MKEHLLELLEPEEAVGKLWHDYASSLGAPVPHGDMEVELAKLRTSVQMVFRGLGGDAKVEVTAAPATASSYRMPVKRKLGNFAETVFLTEFDGERLRLPPVLGVFPSAQMNRVHYIWLAAFAASCEIDHLPVDPLQADVLALAMAKQAIERVWKNCSGLHEFFRQACDFILQTRKRPSLPEWEAAIEAIILELLGGPKASTSSSAAIREAMDSVEGREKLLAPRGYCTFAPVPIWIACEQVSGERGEERSDEQAPPTPQGANVNSKRKGKREKREQADRTDSFIVHRFEAILSWVESMNLNRDVDDDDEKNAQKAADDQDYISLSKNKKKAATRLRLHLDLSPEDADHERLSDKYTYPEWDHRKRTYLEDHCRVLEKDAVPDFDSVLLTDPYHKRRIRQVKRQFEALRPKRIMQLRQAEGAELDLDALVTAQVDLKASGYASDRIFQDARAVERDLSVAMLLDTSRSTESSVGNSSVIEIAGAALAALAGGVDASGDHLGIWGFSSLKRDRVFVNKAKGFQDPMNNEVIAKIGSLKPCYYTRLGAAIRHTTAQLALQQTQRKLLIVLTDGKPNDLDHYEGIHGIEDSHMAVREARKLGMSVHGVIVDEDGQDWFARIFGKGGFTLFPNPERLTRALPDIYRNLTKEY
ncbi:VWA domain-containing protein [Pseudovibrio sp. Tun.PSC04-5.I4]|uniref:nitric oxide reductase activation protein NorD n=1 Tax=Pseudovibrio sp. Tun.PSC04-5.I4 TaxID=1798213 RepID=UPI000881A3FE|nr:VWA domain-containing protein [Pseudovibrio sp. Tun.PSC04-5.I4]SDR33767.1 nitric oxide reductase NorD protein [Pseudovibrio sp. Tun.PSC04-5.I4]